MLRKFDIKIIRGVEDAAPYEITFVRFVLNLRTTNGRPYKL